MVLSVMVYLFFDYAVTKPGIPTLVYKGRKLIRFTKTKKQSLYLRKVIGRYAIYSGTPEVCDSMEL